MFTHVYCNIVYMYSVYKQKPVINIYLKLDIALFIINTYLMWFVLYNLLKW